MNLQELFEKLVTNNSKRHGFLHMKSHFVIRRFANDEAVRAGVPTQVIDATGKLLPAISEFDSNLGLREGIQEAWKLIRGDGGTTAYNNANAQTGVGDDDTSEADTQTDLQAATNKTYKGMDTGYPQEKSGGAGNVKVCVFRSTYASGDANYDWKEFIVRNGATAHLDLIRKVSAQGTKASGQTWELTVEITMA